MYYVVILLLNIEVEKLPQPKFPHARNLEVFGFANSSMH